MQPVQKKGDWRKKMSFWASLIKSRGGETRLESAKPLSAFHGNNDQKLFGVFSASMFLAPTHVFNKKKRYALIFIELIHIEEIIQITDQS